MAKSTEDYRQELINSYTLFNTYEEGQDNTKKEKPVFAEKGDLFVLPYANLRETIKEDPFDYTIARNDDLIGPELKPLSTVVEYVGDGLYKDLITGMIFNTEVLMENVLDFMTDDYKEEAGKEWEKNTDYPLAISTSNLFDEMVPNLFELNNEEKAKIMKDTYNNKELVVEKLKEAEEKAREKVKLLYMVINAKAELRNYDNMMVAEFDEVFNVEGNKRRR